MVFLMVIMYKLMAPTEDTDKYCIRYENITGVKLGTSVTYGGYKIGSVVGVRHLNVNDPEDVNNINEFCGKKPDPKAKAKPKSKDKKVADKKKPKFGNTNFVVKIAVKQGWKIPKASIARIVAPNFLSDVQIDIHENVSEEAFIPGDTLAGEEEVSFMTLMNDVAREVKSVSDTSVRPLLKRLEHHIDNIGNKLSVEIPKIAENTNKLLINLNQGADRLNQILGSENQRHISNVLMNADKMSSKLYEMSVKLDKVQTKLTKVLDSTDKIINRNEQDIRQSVIAMRKSIETVSGSINSIVHNIEQTSRNMNEFSHKIRQNPGLLLGGKSPKEKGFK
jgi:phospholipid/cholesterol/gamma-HCH transport system substrate-binding protein